mgnify:CR=1 FL=1
MFALPLLFNCGDAASIDVESLDSPCGCAEAMVTVLDEAIPMTKDFYGIDKPSDDDKSDYKEDMKPIQDKMGELEEKCVGDLAIEKADKFTQELKFPKELIQLQSFKDKYYAALKNELISRLEIITGAPVVINLEELVYYQDNYMFEYIHFL